MVFFWLWKDMKIFFRFLQYSVHASTQQWNGDAVTRFDTSDQSLQMHRNYTAECSDKFKILSCLSKILK